MVWVIALKEIRENLITLRFALLFLLAMVLVPASLYTNYRSYLTRVADQQQIEKNNLDYLRKLRAAQIFTDPKFTLDLYWPPAVASVFASGFEETHPRHLVVGKNSVEYGAPLDVQSSIGLFGSIDYLFVVQFIFSLFAMLMSFDAITREKECGTLRSILSNSVNRATLATGKLLGGYVTLALPLLLAFLIGMVMLIAGGLDIFAGDFLLRAGWILFASLLFVAVFFLLGLLVSSMVSSTYSALVLSLALWVAAVLVLPRAASLVSQLGRPVQSRQVTWLQKVAAENSIDTEKGRALQEASQKSWITDPQGRRGPGENWDKQRKEIVAPFEERIAQAIRGIEEDYRSRKEAQRRLGLLLARFSPAGALVNFTIEMCGTGISAEERFMEEATRYRQVLQQELFSKFYRDVFPGGGVTMAMLGPIDPGHLPEFHMAKLRVQESLKGADLAILLIWFLLAAALTYVTLARYDVR